MNLHQEEEIHVIRTLECDLCDRYDSILLKKDEINHRVNKNSLNIGSHILPHGDHLRIIYFDIDGIYLGDTISLNVRHQPIQSFDVNVPVFNKITSHPLVKLKNGMLRLLSTKNQKLCIVGPTFAGKTSLTMYLESGIPERYSKRINHSPTMGKSIKRFKFGKTKLTIFDMGGQKNFWSQWHDKIQESNKIIFVIDGSANNFNEISGALKLTVKNLKSESSILVLVNKLDLLHDGYVTEFLSLESAVQLVGNVSKNIWFLYSSIYNGLAYNNSDEIEETPLSKVIMDFLNR